MHKVGDCFYKKKRAKIFVAAVKSKKTRNLYYDETNRLTPILPSIYAWAHTGGWNVFPEIMTNYAKFWVNRKFF
jgi:hypothetical protein